MAANTFTNQIVSDCSGSGRLSMAVKKDVLWKNGQNLYVGCLGGTPDLHKEVKNCAEIWEKVANIKFVFVSKQYPDIRISFNKDDGWWSAVGTQARKVRVDAPTMNLAFTPDCNQTTTRPLILHEFGHALGCIHEHCSPEATILWDSEKVYSEYKKMGWDKKMVDDNVLRKSSRAGTRASKFDPKSIMIYDIPKSLTNNGFSATQNRELSIIDKKFIAEVYPHQEKRASRSSYIERPIFRTKTC